MDKLSRIFRQLFTSTPTVGFLFTTLLSILIPIGLASACYAFHRLRIAHQSSSGTFYGNLDLDGTKNEIRLLVFQKHKWWRGSSKSIRCRFFKVSLDQKPRFMALSYTWGRKDNTRTIFINNTKVSIRENLFDALKHIQASLDKDQLANQYCIWADGVCINQSNVSEKNEQVQKMDKIFQSAFRVIAYLGPEKDNCNMVFDECNDAGMRLFYSGLFYYSTLAHSDPQIRNRLYQRAREDGTFFLQFVKEHGNYVQTSSAAKLQGILCLDAILHEESKRHDLSNNVPLVTSNRGSNLQNAWQSFCQRSFWTRVWILQELALGNDVILRAGSRTTELEYFLAIFCLNYARVRATAIDSADLRRHKDNAELMANIYGDAYDLIHCIFRSMQEPRDLETLIYDTQLLQAENNIDKIYALLGLATNKEELGIEPDYKKSFEDGCQELSECLVLKRGTPALSYTRSRLESDKISSWANIYCLLKHDPKNKIERKLMPMSGNRFDGDFKFSTSGDFTQAFSKESFPSPTKLKIKGFAVSTISEVTTINFDHRRFWNDRDDDRDVKEALKLHEQLRKFVSILKDDRLWWVPTRHRDPQKQSSESGSYPRLHQSLLDSYHALKKVAGGSADGDILQQTQLFRRMVRQCVEDQSFFITSNRTHVGMGSSALQEQDEIIIFLGGEMPFAIRPTGNDTYRLLGEVYVLGIMHGEFFSQERHLQEYLLE